MTIPFPLGESNFWLPVEEDECVHPEWFFNNRFPPKVACVVPVSNIDVASELLADIKLEFGLVDSWVVNNLPEYQELTSNMYIDEELITVEPLGWFDSCNFAAKYISKLDEYRYICFIPETARLSDRFFQSMLKAGTDTKSAVVAPLLSRTDFKDQYLKTKKPLDSFDYRKNTFEIDNVDPNGVMIHSAAFDVVGFFDTSKKNAGKEMENFCRSVNRRGLGAVVSGGSFVRL